MSGPSKVEEPNESCHKHDQDFSEAWGQSDVILIVEEKQLHVHRVILAMSSPVFSRMFDGDFKEKNAKEIPLPGKNYNEIKEMLLVIYPSSWKPIAESNLKFLLALAQEYQMKNLTQKCEDYLMDALAKEGSDLMETLLLAQNYALERLLDECIVRTQSLSSNEVKKHPLYDQIELLFQKRMIELQMQKGEKEIQRLKLLASRSEKKIERFKCLADEALQKLREMARSLEWHINVADCNKVNRNSQSSINSCLQTIKEDRPVHERRRNICKSLQEVGDPMEKIHSNLLAICGFKIQKLA